MSEPRTGAEAAALAGNAAALVLLVALLASGPVLFGGSPPPEIHAGRRATVRAAAADAEAPRPGRAAAGPQAKRPDPRPPRAGRALLVVVDGLRTDAASDPGAMPGLVRLARQGGRGVARIDSLLPSTLSGIRTLAEGSAPAPASFLEDFAAGRSAGGGLPAVLAARGKRTFAAGPRLWRDLYGPWLAGAAAVETVRGDDARVLAAALRALAGPYDLVIAHFTAPDDAAHLAGAITPEAGLSPLYRRAVASTDAALARLTAAAGPGTAILVTADHGVAGGGGHAGPEPAVLEVPIVTRGPGLPAGELGRLRQGDVPALLARSLGVPFPPAALPRSPGRVPLAGILLSLLAGGLALLHLAALLPPPRDLGPDGAAHAGSEDPAVAGNPASPSPRQDVPSGAVASESSSSRSAAPAREKKTARLLPDSRRRRLTPEILDAALWAGIAAALLGSPPAGLALALLALATTAPPLRIARRLALAGAALAAGLLAGILRLAEASLTARHLLPGAGPGRGPGGLLAVAILATGAGLALGPLLARSRRTGPILTAGIATALLPVLLARLLGETASLTTLDVRWAFRLADSSLGLAGAVAVAVLRAGLPTLALLAGLAAGLVPMERRRSPASAAFAAGVGAFLAGEALAGTAGLATGSPAVASLALGLLVRLLGEATFLFLGTAALLALGRILPGTPPRGAKRPSAQVPRYALAAPAPEGGRRRKEGRRSQAARRTISALWGH